MFELKNKEFDFRFFCCTQIQLFKLNKAPSLTESMRPLSDLCLFVKDLLFVLFCSSFDLLNRRLSSEIASESTR